MLLHVGHGKHESGVLAAAAAVVPHEQRLRQKPLGLGSIHVSRQTVHEAVVVLVHFLGMESDTHVDDDDDDSK